jgi:hypothetical protein
MALVHGPRRAVTLCVMTNDVLRAPADRLRHNANSEDSHRTPLKSLDLQGVSLASEHRQSQHHAPEREHGGANRAIVKNRCPVGGPIW